MTEVYGVFEGGGVRGTALVGAVAAAEENGISFRAVAGTSAGAIVASLIAAGYTASEMRALLTRTDFRTFKDPVSLLYRLPGLRPWLVWRKLGLYKGDEFHRWIGEQLSLKLTQGKLRNESPTFTELPNLKVIATDVTRQRVIIFSKEHSADMVVADAVRMSMSIPFFFTPVTLAGSSIVDGGALSNFPAWAFDAEREAAPLPILGFRLQPDDVPPPRIKTAFDLAMALIFTMTRANIPLQISHVSGLHEIKLPTLGVETTNFDISESQKDELYEAGYGMALDYLANQPLTPPTGQ